jgi:hypothetical protein
MMAETATENGKATRQNTTQPEGKRPARLRSLPSLQSVTSISSMKEAAFLGKVDQNATEWQLLKNFTCFSTAEDGSFPMVKVSKSKAVSLTDGKAYSVGSGRCYRIFLSLGGKLSQ